MEPGLIRLLSRRGYNRFAKCKKLQHVAARCINREGRGEGGGIVGCARKREGRLKRVAFINSEASCGTRISVDVMRRVL